MIFVSYAHEDRVRVERLIQCLEQSGLSVRWDRGISGRLSAEIEAEIEAATLVLVAWTQAARDSDWVQGEATLAHQQDKLFQVRLGDVELPIPFIPTSYVDLLNWDENSDSDHPEFVALLQKLLAALHGTGVETPTVGKTDTLEPTTQNAAQAGEAELVRQHLNDLELKAKRKRLVLRGVVAALLVSGLGVAAVREATPGSGDRVPRVEAFSAARSLLVATNASSIALKKRLIEILAWNPGDLPPEPSAGGSGGSGAGGNGGGRPHGIKCCHPSGAIKYCSKQRCVDCGWEDCQ